MGKTKHTDNEQTNNNNNKKKKQIKRRLKLLKSEIKQITRLQTQRTEDSEGMLRATVVHTEATDTSLGRKQIENRGGPTKQSK